MNFRNYRAKDVDAYIAAAAAAAQPKLKELRQLILATIPGAEEKISWGIPFYRHHGLLAGIAPFTHHISFGLVAVLSDKDRKELEAKGYATGKKTVQIRYDQKTPAAILRQMLQAQAAQNMSKKKHA